MYKYFYFRGELYYFMVSVLSKILNMASSAQIQKPGWKVVSSLQFDNKAIRALPVDKETRNFVRQVPNACFSMVVPTPVKNPQMVACSSEALKLIDIDGQEALNNLSTAEYFSGTKLIPGSQTAAHCYCGHQFGYFSGQLGDGAAIYLGEVINNISKRWELQLKGAGPTPYSRHADGRKVLRSSIREFLCSEIMYHLGIPTTRAGTIITSDSFVVRDQFYDGNAKEERCTVVLRLAPTFIRFGSFEICLPEDSMTGRCGPSYDNSEILSTLLNYVVETFFPDIWQLHKEVASEDMYLDWYKEVVKRTAKLVAEWQSVGWCHGVLNTDNMSIAGLTIDYGPFGFIDRFDPDYICNLSDDGGRYTYAKQPEICKWNCEKLAHALKNQIPLEKSLRVLEEAYNAEFDSHYKRKMKRKLGLIHSDDPLDETLINEFLSTMHKTGADFTNSWNILTSLPYHFDVDEAAAKFLDQCSSIEEIRQSLKPSMSDSELQMMLTLIRSNPGLLQQLGRGAMRLAKELKKIEKLEELKNMTNDSKNEVDSTLWKTWLQKYNSRLSIDLAASMNYDDLNAANNQRQRVMNEVNPRFVLRNHHLEEAIQLAEEKDFSGVRALLNAFPYVYGSKQGGSCDAEAGMDEFISHYELKPPRTALNIKVS